MDFFAAAALLYKNRFVIGLVSLAFFVLACFTYYIYASSKIELLEKDNRTLQQVVEDQKRQIETIKKNYENLIKAKDQLQREIDDIRRQEQEEIDKIQREERNKKSLEELALKKSKLVERAINRATQNVFQCFEIISLGGDC